MIPHLGERLLNRAIKRRLARLSALVVLFALAPAGVKGSAAQELTAGSKPVRPLKVILVNAPRFKVPGYDTRGSYLQVRSQTIGLKTVNLALRESILNDQSAYAPFATTVRKKLEGPNGPGNLTRGLYQIHVVPSLVSASTRVVSALLPRIRRAYRNEKGGEGWVSVTVRVPSGKPVTIGELFTKPAGLRFCGARWRETLRRRRTTCPDTYPEVYGTSTRNYRHFALAPKGLAVGVGEAGACGAWSALVPYRELRPYLSKLGQVLVSGVRQPASS